MPTQNVAASARERATSLGTPWNAGAGAAALESVFAHAELIADVTEAGAAQTASRTRRQQHGNTERAADDPQFLRVLADADARSAVASATADSLVRRAAEGGISVDEAALLAAGLQPLAREAVRALFETLGASSTLTEHGLHDLWTRLHDLETVSPA